MIRHGVSTRFYRICHLRPFVCEPLDCNGGLAVQKNIWENSRYNDAFTVLVPDAGPCRSNFRDHPARTNFFRTPPATESAGCAEDGKVERRWSNLIRWARVRGHSPFFFPNLKKGEYPRNEKRRGPLWIRAYAPRTKSRVCVHVRVWGLKRWKRNSSPPYSARQRARSGTQQPNLPFLIRSFERNGDIRRLIHVHVQEFALFFFLWKFILHFLNRRKHLRILIWKNISVYLNNFFKYHT